MQLLMFTYYQSQIRPARRCTTLLYLWKHNRLKLPCSRLSFLMQQQIQSALPWLKDNSAKSCKYTCYVTSLALNSRMG